MNNRRIALGITIAVVLIAAAAAVYYARSGGVSRQASLAPVQAPLRIGDPAPEFSAATDNGYVDLKTAKSPVFLEVFATWCPHCQRETAIIDRLYQQYGSKVQFVGVSGSNQNMTGNGPSSQQDVLAFVQAFHVQYPVAYDPTLDVAHRYLQGGFPTIVIIGEDKKIAYMTSGEVSYAELDSALRSTFKS